MEATDDLHAFNSEAPRLDAWFKQFALSDQRANASVTYALARGQKVVGFYTLAPSAIYPGQTTRRFRAGLPRARPVPVILLARLGVDNSEQGRGLGGDLLADALTRCAAAAYEIGGRAVLVHTKNEASAGFYIRYGFRPLAENPEHMYLLMKDLRASLRESLGKRIDGR